MLLFLPLLFFSVAADDFDDSFARNLMLPVASAAYSDSPQQCLDNKLNGAKVSQQVTLQCDFFKRDKCSAFTFVDESKKVMGLSFRGTDNVEGLLLDMADTAFESKVDFKDGGKISAYFDGAFWDIWNGGIGADLNTLIRTYHDYDLWITGHSIGGAFASLASAHLVSLDWYDADRIKLYTFGQPRVGDQEFANVHDGFLPTAYRVVHDRDLFVHSPPEFMKYVHHRHEVFYDNNMKEGAKYTVCKEQEDKKCSDKYIFETSITDHTHYYGKAVSDYGRKGCK